MLRVDFAVQEPLPQQLDSFATETSVSALVIRLEKETMVALGDPVSGDTADALAEVRARLSANNAEAALVVINAPSNRNPTVISFIGEGSRPMQRMLYSSAVGRVQELLRTHTSVAQATAVSEIEPSLLKHGETGQAKQDLMTESEKRQAEIAQMEVAPQGGSLPGVGVQLTPAAESLLRSLAAGDVAGAVFKIENEKVDRDAEIASGDVEAVVAALSGTEPRFAFAHHTPEGGARQLVMVYLCPASCKPREKMTYASSRAAFLAAASAHGVNPAKRVEASEKDEIPTVVAESFIALEDDGADQTSQGGPKPPGKPSWMKGPRMMI